MPSQYLGLHPGVFKNSATKAVEYAQAARTVGTGLIGAFAGGFSKAAAPSTPPAPAANKQATGWGKWAGTASYAVGGALLAGAAAGASYYKRDDLGLGYSWATDHMKYVSHLWDGDALGRRVEFLVDAQEREGVQFRKCVVRCPRERKGNSDDARFLSFYTYLPPTPLLHSSERTFIVLPKKNAKAAPHFVLARNGLASDELEAHTGMFSGKTNDGYYDLGLQAAQVIREAVISARGIIDTTPPPVDSKLFEQSAWGEDNDVPVDATSPAGPAVSTKSPAPEQSPWGEDNHVLIDTTSPETPPAPAPVDPNPKPSTQPPEMAEWGKEWQ